MVTLADARPSGEKPNVILIFVDDSGYGDYTHNGNPTIATPNISKLAHQGANFTQFYVTSPACSASRYSLLTGRYPGRSGLGGWVVGPQSRRHLHQREITIAECLKKRGYTTGMFGKWHMGSPNKKNSMAPDSLPLAHGFDRWIGTNVSHDYGNAMLIKSEPQGKSPIDGYQTLARNLPQHQKISESLTGLYTDSAISFIKENKDRPFFAYIAPNQPHLGLFAGESFKGVSRRGLLGDVMNEIDHSIGRILQALDDEGLSENTLIIYSSDNGPWVLFQDTKKHPSYGEARMHVGYALPFRDGKGSTWEGGHRVPGIFYWPGTVHPSVIREPASTLDILPTVCNMTGAIAPEPETLDGRDISPYLTGEDRNVDPFEFLFSYSDNLPSAIRVGPWKLHTRIGSQRNDNYGFKASVESPLLFQVEQDLGERFDRANEQPDTVDQLRGKLLEMTREIKKTGSYWDE